MHYSLSAHMYSYFTGLLYFISGTSERLFKRKVLIENLPMKGNEHVLDICCANGKGTKIISSFFKEGIVYGIDLNPKMIFRAMKYSTKRENIKFKVGDCSNIPFQDNSFEIVTSFLALHELPTNLLPKVILEIKRVLKSSGYLLVFDFAIPAKSFANINFVYYTFRLIEDESAARFMMINHGEFFKQNGLQVVKHQKYMNGFINVYLLINK
ncbi:MAG: class I SAM-dependent methyltransferase [Candidatus Heimdallarchaeota archaeon]|nr:class I SAM-dependent methyltransferase [Candidatus Heimdallarchaeota archaeon]